VRFSGGNQDAHTSRTFHITFTAPATPGTALFPTVQHCGETDTSWLDVQAAGQPEPEPIKSEQKSRLQSLRTILELLLPVAVGASLWFFIESHF